MTDGYVTDDSGTGIVHCAPAFGEDDFRVCIDHGVVTGEGDLPNPVDATGCFTAEVKDYKGIYVKVGVLLWKLLLCSISFTNTLQEADKPIQKDLKAKGRLIRQSQISHSYPFCWR